MTELKKGECLCGAVKFRFSQPTADLQACHCRQCQRWTGGSPLIGVKVRDVQIEGEDRIGRYHASAHGERAFCKDCGTTLFWRMQGRGVDFLCAGLLEDQSGLSMTEEIFVDCRADWQPPWPDAAQSTEAEEIAKFQAYVAKHGEPGA